MNNQENAPTKERRNTPARMISDHVASNAKHSYFGALLYIFEDNEAVIKVIVKGISPTMRHVSRTHRVALDWLFDRTNLDPTILVKYVDTKNQLEDMLTKGNFTRDEWDHLLRLLDIMSFSMCSCRHFSPIDNTMSKRLMQEEKPGEEERVVAKSKPMMSFLWKIVDQSPIALVSSASNSPGTLKAHSSNSDFTCPERPVARGLIENTASGSDVWHSDVNQNTSTVRPVAETTKKPIGYLTTTWRFPGTVLAILRKSTRKCDKNLSRQPGDDMICLTSTSTR